MGKLVILAWRNVWRNGRRTIIAVLAIALGLVLLLFFDGLYSGAEQAIYGNLIRLQGGNVQAHAPGFGEKANRLPLYPLDDAEAVISEAGTLPMVVASSRRIRTGGMIGTREGTLPVIIIGVELNPENPGGLIAEKIVEGRYLQPGDEDHLVIGRALGRTLQAAVGDRVTMVGRAAHEQMRRRTMTVVGIYDLGIPDMEKRMAYISLDEAQTLFGLRDQATEVVILLERVGQEPEVVHTLQAALPNYEIASWATLNPEATGTMEMEKQVMGIFGLIILLIAAVGVLNLMLMAVFERTREIGLLAAMGLKRWEIMVLFLLEGTMIGLFGALAGCALGGAVVTYLGRVGLQWSADASDYSELAGLLGGRIYFALTAELLLQRALAVLIIAALAAVYPAWKASRREPAEALHYV